MGSDIAVFGPASLSNLGPGFDTLGLAITGLGDVVKARLTDSPGVEILCSGSSVLPCEPHLNTAGRAASIVLEQANTSQGIALTVEKGIPIGSGIGGSAASAAAGAWAVNVLLGKPFDRSGLVEAVLEGEAVASGGSRHGDNVLPALFGGLVLTSSVNPADYRHLRLSQTMHLALLLPRLEILTAEARALLPAAVPFRAAVENASDLALMIQSLIAGDWSAVGRYMVRDRLVEPVRARLVSCYQDVREAAIAEGAWGCALTGSGPAMFAIVETADIAEKVCIAMRAVCESAGIEARAMVAKTDNEGVRVL